MNSPKNKEKNILRIVFLGAKDIGTACLQFLLEQSQILPVEVVAVRSRLSAKGKGVLTLAEQYDIPALESLDDLPDCDIIYSVQHHELLKQKHIDKATKIAVNLHLAPLPEYRGCNQFTFAILDEAKTFGVTIHQIDSRIDHGKILFEKKFPIPKTIWVNELVDLSVEKGVELFKETLAKLIYGDYVLKNQRENMTTAAGQLNYRKDIEKVKDISLDLSEEDIRKRIRATMMPGFEPPFIRIGDKKVYFSFRQQKNLSRAFESKDKGNY